MSLQKDGSKLIENIIKMIAHIHSKHVQQSHLLMNFLEEIVQLPVREYSKIFGPH